jgi:hypothetical protein|tara:strand:- start:59648 stop:60379 length:732 start_codon:yes stop_codon:yes gene_type:complete
MKDQDYILFEEFLSGNLSKDANNSFENSLKNEDDFKQAFETYKKLSRLLAHKFENEDKQASFQTNLKNISDTYFNKKEPTKKVIRFKPWQYAMAASIAIFIGIYWYSLFSIPTYGDFANFNEISLTVRGGENELLTKAENSFNNKNFTEAETYFTQLLSIESENQEFKLYKAISGIELNKFTEAEVLLKQISKGNSVFKSSANWYLALSKLKQKDYKTCSEILKRIPSDAGDYKNAQKLLKKL